MRRFSRSISSYDPRYLEGKDLPGWISGDGVTYGPDGHVSIAGGASASLDNILTFADGTIALDENGNVMGLI